MANFQVRAISFREVNVALKIRVAIPTAQRSRSQRGIFKKSTKPRWFWRKATSQCGCKILGPEKWRAKRWKQNRKKDIVFQKTCETWSFGHSLRSSWVEWQSRPGGRWTFVFFNFRCIASALCPPIYLFKVGGSSYCIHQGSPQFDRVLDDRWQSSSKDRVCE